MSRLMRRFSICLVILLIIRIANRKRLRAKAARRPKPREPTDATIISETITVDTKKGKVRGFVAIAPDSKKKIANFRGIPYAAPPIGKNRFKHPKDANSWRPDIL